MINKTLNPNIFNTDVEQIPIRKGFGTGLVKAGEQNESVVALCADLTESTQMHLFKEKFPNRFVEIGVAEQNLASVASGMAAMGKIPFFSSYAMFSPGRNWEQIRTTIAYNNQKAIIVGSHAGVSVGPDGGTHQAIEDIAITRVIPNMTVISPCDSIEAEKATLACIPWKTPVYLRLAREKTPIITTQETPFEIGKGYVVFGDTTDIDVVIFATGALVYQSILTAQKLAEEGKKVTVVNIHTIKPLDTTLILDLARKSKFGVVSVEEHQKAGGLGSTISEYLSQNHPTKQAFVGVDDRFGQSGTPAELIEHYGLGVDGITKAVNSLLL
jgi:transketolase